MSENPREAAGSFQETQRERNPWALHQQIVGRLFENQERQLLLAFGSGGSSSGRSGGSGSINRVPKPPHITFLSLIGAAALLTAAVAGANQAWPVAAVAVAVWVVAWGADIATGRRF